MMVEKTIQIIAPEGYEVDKEKSSFEKIVFRALPDKGLPRRWEDMEAINGFVVGILSTVDGPYTLDAGTRNRNTWPTREEAEASIALAQLCQLRDRYNGGWKPDWISGAGTKYCITISGDKPTATGSAYSRYVLHFKTAELRDKFMENFSELIEKAKPLLG